MVAGEKKHKWRCEVLLYFEIRGMNVDFSLGKMSVQLQQSRKFTARNSANSGRAFLFIYWLLGSEGRKYWISIDFGHSLLIRLLYGA